MMRRLFLALPLLLVGCSDPPHQTTVSHVDPIAVEKRTNGLTIEQQNIHDRLIADNQPGAIKHLYVISPYSGQVLIYSTVRGKVTSSGKRLHPSSQTGDARSFYSATPFVAPDGETDYTSEVIGDDGTYGASGDYLYWWDARGVYHQHYLTGGQIVHISDQPLAVKSIVLNMELDK